MKVILISAKAQHGKDTAAELLKEMLNGKVLIGHYADLLKYICKTYFDWNGEKDEAGRTLLQRIGTDIIRKKQPDYWVKFLADIITFFPEKWDYIIIPDCRFPNEIEYMKKRFDTTTIRVKRLNYDNGLTEEQKQHPSETALDNYKFDYYINAPSGIDNLKKEIEKIKGEL